MSNVSEFSTTAASNNSASPNGFPESMAPSGVNDSARELMAALAKWYKDTQGTITTGGTTTAYTLTTNSAHAALNDIPLFAMQINAANTGSATLNVDSLGAKTMKIGGANLAAGDLATDEIVMVVYNPDNDVFDVFKSFSGLLDEDNMSSDSATRGATQQSIKAYVDNTSRTLSGQKTGLIMSNNGTDSDHDIDVAAGKAADSTDSVLMTVSAITKRIDATWSSGTGNGGLSSSLTAPANNTTYHVFLVRIGGSDDVLFDTSVTCANGVTDHSVTHYRRIGSVLTNGSANILGFTQAGDFFAFDAIQTNVNANNPGTSAVLATVSVPSGVRTLAKLSIGIDTGSAGNVLALVSCPDSTDASPGAGNANAGAVAASDGVYQSNEVNVLTNTSSQVRYRLGASGANTDVFIATHGWRDFL